MKKSKNSLASLIDKIDWQVLTGPRSYHGLAEDAVTIATYKSRKILDHADTIRFRFGPGVISELGWKFGDKIVAQYDPDDVFYFLLLKSGSVSGRTLCKESKTLITYVNYRWTNTDVSLEERKNELVEYEIHDKFLACRLPQ